ncbi:cytochrome P450 [Streptomyces sp. NPDC058045]|uniref:cytochrome P450 n=1 Tax=Streptomyces sp. NPDC058045 TaxID=3346311 RepID=UPI0036E12079
MKDLPRLPFDNPAVMGVAPRMRALQRERPIARVRTAGEDAWLVTQYDEVKALLSDRRLGLSDPKPTRAAKSTARLTMSTGTFRQVVDSMTELVRRKRTDPGDDILSELIAEKNGSLTDDYIAQLGCAVLLFGYETTMVRIDMGVLLMLRNPAQRAQLAKDPGLAPAAVEEIPRLAVGGKGSNALIPRYAHGDITVGDTVIRTGDAVMLAIGAANVDSRAYPESDLLDLARIRPKSHMAFGHGTRHRVGRVLARIELTTVFERLFPRLPNLRLAVPEGSLRWREHRITGGFDEIPVSF